MGQSEVRDEDAFDVPAVQAWLRSVADVPGELPVVRQFTSGASNLTFVLRYPSGEELVLRRPPAGTKAASAHDMGREFRVQSALRPVFGKVPAMVGYCDDLSVIGSPFYVMEKVDGVVLHGDLPEGVHLSTDDARELGARYIRTLTELHAVDVDVAGLRDLGRGPGYVRRQVEGWTKRYRAARTDNVPDFATVASWLDATAPPDVAERLIHNDFRIDNFVLYDRWQVVAVLDWEMATIGDPLMDLGGALAYWVEPGDALPLQAFKRQPSDLPGMPSRSELVRSYGELTGVTIDDWPFYEVFGLFRLAGIAQQIYYRYHHGQTTNPLFADFWQIVVCLEERCRTIIGTA